MCTIPWLVNTLMCTIPWLVNTLMCAITWLVNTLMCAITWLVKHTYVYNHMVGKTHLCVQSHGWKNTMQLFINTWLVKHNTHVQSHGWQNTTLMFIITCYVYKHMVTVTWLAKHTYPGTRIITWVPKRHTFVYKIGKTQNLCLQ